MSEYLHVQCEDNNCIFCIFFCCNHVIRINFIVAREVATISSCCGEGVQVRRERGGGRSCINIFVL